MQTCNNFVSFKEKDTETVNLPFHQYTPVESTMGETRELSDSCATSTARKA